MMMMMMMMIKRPAQPHRRPVHRSTQDVCFSSPASLVSIMDNGRRARVQPRCFPHWSSHVGGEEQSS